MSRTSPDPKERPKAARARLMVFAFIIALSVLVMAGTLLLGPFSDPQHGTASSALIAVPVGIGTAFAAFIIYLFIQLRRR